MAQVVAAAAGLWVGRRLDRRRPAGGDDRRIGAGRRRRRSPSPLAPTSSGSPPPGSSMGVAMSATLYAPAFTVLTHWAGGASGPGPDHRHAGRGARLDGVRPARRAARGRRARGAAPTSCWPSRWPPRSPRTGGAFATRGPAVALAAPTTSPAPASAAERRPACVRRSSACSSRRSPWPGSASTPRSSTSVPLLTEGGLTPLTAAIALGLGGVGQVAGRLVYGPRARPDPGPPAHRPRVAAASATTLGPGLLRPVGAARVRGLVRGRGRAWDLHPDPGDRGLGPVGHPRLGARSSSSPGRSWWRPRSRHGWAR